MDLCEAVADVIIVELRHLTAEERAEIHAAENSVFDMQQQGKASRARQVRG